MSDVDADQEERTGAYTLAGGGELEYAIRGRENAVRTLETDIRTAANRWGSRYFQDLDRSDYRRPPLVTRDREHPSIREAVADANTKPSWEARDAGEMAYVVEEAYYPDDFDHFVDLTEIDVADRAHAVMHAQSELAQRGFVVNSLRSDDDGRLTKLHVVRMRWLDELRGREDGDAN